MSASARTAATGGTESGSSRGTPGRVEGEQNEARQTHDERQALGLVGTADAVAALVKPQAEGPNGVGEHQETYAGEQSPGIGRVERAQVPRGGGEQQPCREAEQIHQQHRAADEPPPRAGVAVHLADLPPMGRDVDPDSMTSPPGMTTSDDGGAKPSEA